MKISMLSTAAAIALVGVASSALGNTILTFDEGLGMPNAEGSAVPGYAQIGSSYQSEGVVFSSGGGYVALVNHEPTQPSATPSYPNIIAGTDAGGTLNYAASITATFVVPGTSYVGATDFVKVLGDLDPAGHGGATLTAYDAAGNLLGSVFSADCCALGDGPILSFSHAGIHTVVISEDNNSIGYDNFQFDTPAAVPDPSIYFLMTLGTAILGVSLRKRRQKAKSIVKLALHTEVYAPAHS